MNRWMRTVSDANKSRWNRFWSESEQVRDAEMMLQMPTHREYAVQQAAVWASRDTLFAAMEHPEMGAVVVRAHEA